MHLRSLSLLSSLALTSAAVAAPISFTLENGYAQNFDSLPSTTTTTGVSWSGQVADWNVGWSISATSSPQLRVGPGTSSSLGFWSFGAEGAADRALGSINSDTWGSMYYGFALVNDTGVALDSFTVAYKGEQWRLGAVGTTSNYIESGYRFTTADNVGGLFSGTTILMNNRFDAPITEGTASSALDGNAAANSATVSNTVAATWNPGDVLWIRFRDSNAGGIDSGLSIDDLTVTATVPEPTALAAAALCGLGLLARRRA